LKGKQMGTQYKPLLVFQTYSEEIMKEAVFNGFMARDDKNRSYDNVNKHPNFTLYESQMNGQPWTLYLKDQSLMTIENAKDIIREISYFYEDSVLEDEDGY